MNFLESHRLIDAPAWAAWQVIADMEGYADITAPNITRVEVLDGEGEGMLRRCTNDKGQTWTETCPLWEEGRQFRFIVNTKAPDYPYPLEMLEGLWAVEPRGQQTLLRARFDYRPKYGKVLGKLVSAAMVKQGRKDIEFMLDHWAARAQELACVQTET